MSIREINARAVAEAVRELCVEANTILRRDVLSALKKARKEETVKKSHRMLGVLIENASIAEKNFIPICQDTGMVVVFVEMGAGTVITGGQLADAVNKGVSEAYQQARFRSSIVDDPLRRTNTGDNTPAVLYLESMPGDVFRVSVLAKGFGSENKSAIRMMNPTSSKKEIIDFCVETVSKAGPDACPPLILGIGIGGSMDSCAVTAKKALLRPIGEKGPEFDFEEEIKNAANELGIGIMGLGGGATVLGVNVERKPTHIAGLPVAVNVCCHALRSATVEL